MNEMGLTDKRYMSTRAACEYLDISRNTFTSLLKAGKLPQPIHLGPRMRRWDRVEIDKYVSQIKESDHGEEHDSAGLGGSDPWDDRDGAS